MRFVISLLGVVVVGGAVGCSTMASAPKSAASAPEATVKIADEKPAGNAKKVEAPEAEEVVDAADFRGNMWGDSIGDSYGAGGLGLSGVGPGGGGTGEGIGLGTVGTIGHGAGSGTGQGYGSGSGRLAGSGAASKARISAATATTAGEGLPAEVIKRLVRQQMAKVRACYEKAMIKDPTLSGKMALKFTIDAKGAVSQASVGDTTIADADMGSCLVAVMKTLSFPAPDNGGIVVVTYPFQFAPGD